MSMKVDLDSVTWSAAGQTTIRFDRLPATVDGLPAHVARIDFELDIGIDDDPSNATPGDEIIRAISRLEVRDRLGNVIWNLQGHMLRTYLKMITGRVAYADPSDISAGTAGVVDRVVYFSLPFHGGHGGILGFRSYADLLQPCDRFREGGYMTVYWGSATPFEASSTGTIDNATLYPSVVVEPRSDLIVGVDLRHTYYSHDDAQYIKVATKGLRMFALGLFNTDLDHSDYTSITVDVLRYLSAVRPQGLIADWNHSSAVEGQADYEDPATGEFLPIVYPKVRGKLLNTIGVGDGEFRVELTNSNGTTQYSALGAVYNTQRLAAQLLTLPSTVFTGRRMAKPRLELKAANRGMGARKAGILTALLAQKLTR